MAGRSSGPRGGASPIDGVSHSGQREAEHSPDSAQKQGSDEDDEGPSSAPSNHSQAHITSQDGRARGRKKKPHKRKPKKLPYIVDLTVHTTTGTKFTLKAISTDTIAGVKRLLADHVETCHETSYQLRHENGKGHDSQLEDMTPVVALQPAVLHIVAVNYTSATAVLHVQRLLDIVACVSRFGPSAQQLWPEQYTAKAAACGTAKDKDGAQSESSALAVKAGVNAAPSMLSEFYPFFSMAHLTKPFKSIRRSSVVHSEPESLLSLEVELSDSNTLQVTACPQGFFVHGKQRTVRHTVVDLLRYSSRRFAGYYATLLDALEERNEFGHLPIGLRSNTWIARPDPQQLLPTEDPAWCQPEPCSEPQTQQVQTAFSPSSASWVAKFASCVRMPNASEEERQLRDRQLYLVHNAFVQTGVHAACRLLETVTSPAADLSVPVELNSQGLHMVLSSEGTTVGAACPQGSFSRQVAGGGAPQREVCVKNLVQGLTVHSNAVFADTAALATVIVRHGGYMVKVHGEGAVVGEMAGVQHDCKEEAGHCDGSGSLNANSLRTTLHSEPAVTLDEGREVLLAMLKESQLDEEAEREPPIVRWELGACWLQHLQAPKKAVTMADKDADASKGDSKRHTSSSSRSKHAVVSSAATTVNGAADTNPTSLAGTAAEPSSPQSLQDCVGSNACSRLQAANIGLHTKTVDELVEGARNFYQDTALPRLVADCASLELSPVDGRTLTDFMHARGLHMCSLGKVAELSEDLAHLKALCILEMVSRALKRLVRAVMAAASGSQTGLAAVLAATFNAVFGSDLEGSQVELGCTLWKWTQRFVQARFRYCVLDEALPRLRRLALLRAICTRVGIEVAAKDYNFSTPTPFEPADIVAVYPVYQHVPFSSADGRSLMEVSKAALDRGELDEAFSSATQALGKLSAVFGAWHCVTAGAYSLLAVVLYHKGDFLQAAVYQQKALHINERELGLDHPDTMKSYGDLAVFYYRLEHTELAHRYVSRALYLLHLTCGASHPNTAATYINVAMMEQGLGHVHISLRYLHEALMCNKHLLGPTHVQTAASYHAIAIALSLIEAYTLSVQHEQTTLSILEAKLGADDMRTQDAAAWLEYFESKLEEQQADISGRPSQSGISNLFEGGAYPWDDGDYGNGHINGMTSMRRKQYADKMAASLIAEEEEERVKKQATADKGKKKKSRFAEGPTACASDIPVTDERIGPAALQSTAVCDLAHAAAPAADPSNNEVHAPLQELPSADVSVRATLEDNSSIDGSHSHHQLSDTCSPCSSECDSAASSTSSGGCWTSPLKKKKSKEHSRPAPAPAPPSRASIRPSSAKKPPAGNGVATVSFTASPVHQPASPQELGPTLSRAQSLPQLANQPPPSPQTFAVNCPCQPSSNTAAHTPHGSPNLAPSNGALLSYKEMLTQQQQQTLCNAIPPPQHSVFLHTKQPPTPTSLPAAQQQIPSQQHFPSQQQQQQEGFTDHSLFSQPMPLLNHAGSNGNGWAGMRSNGNGLAADWAYIRNSATPDWWGVNRSVPQQLSHNDSHSSPGSQSPRPGSARSGSDVAGSDMLSGFSTYGGRWPESAIRADIAHKQHVGLQNSLLHMRSMQFTGMGMQELEEMEQELWDVMQRVVQAKVDAKVKHAH
eukprot:jgi/Chlat1/5864/Chrsp4S06238